MESLGICLLTFCGGSIRGGDRIEFDFHAPFGIEKLSHNDHRSCWADLREILTVDSAYGFPVFDMG